MASGTTEPPADASWQAPANSLFAEPGEYGAPSEPAFAAPPGDPDQPRTARFGGRDVPGRLVALLAVLVLVVAGGGYYLMHGSSSPAADQTAVTHHVTAQPGTSKPTAKRHGGNGHAAGHQASKHRGSKHAGRNAGAAHSASNRARQLSYAGATFSALPVQLAGWQPQGHLTLHRLGALSAVERQRLQAVERCAGTTIPVPASVALSQSYVQGSFDRFGIGGQGEVDFFRSAQAARRSLAGQSNPAALKCAHDSLANWMGPARNGVRYSSMSAKVVAVHGLAGATAIEEDATIDSASAGQQPVRVIQIQVRVGARSIQYTSFGVRRAQTVASATNVLKAMVAEAQAQHG